MGLEQVDQTVDVVDAWILDSATREYGFEQFLDGLLGVEADRVVGDLGVVNQLVEDELVGSGLAQQQPETGDSPPQRSEPHRPCTNGTWQIGSRAWMGNKSATGPGCR